MSDSTVDRRKLIQGTGAAIAGTVLVGAEASSTLAQSGHDHATPVSGTPESGGIRSASTRSPLDGGWQFLGPGEAAKVAAIADRLIPADDLGPSASEAGVVVFIDRALAGFYSDSQQTYQRGLAALDRFANARYDDDFVRLTPQQQDELLMAMEEGVASEFDVPSAETFFALVRRHVMEGFLADPIYGGNRDFIGWRLVNFPGPVFAYSVEEMQSGEELHKPFVSLADQFPNQ
jgi:gluconate 2-dehydrogenase gamma chain